MGRKVVIFLVSLAVLTYAIPVTATDSVGTDGPQTVSNGKAVPLSASAISHYQQMQSLAQAKGLLALHGGSPVTDDQALLVFLIAAAAIAGLTIAFATS